MTEPFTGPDAFNEAVSMSGQLPYYKPYFFIARLRVYPIQTREARHSVIEIRG
jgi:hypothetical protein